WASPRSDVIHILLAEEKAWMPGTSRTSPGMTPLSCPNHFSHCSSAAAGRPLHPLRHQPLAFESLLAAGCSSLVVFRVLVDVPHVMDALACQNVAGREHGGHHGVVLIVVFVHAVAADQVKRGITAVEIEADHREVLSVAAVID